MNPFQYKPDILGFTLKREKRNERWLRYAIDFPISSDDRFTDAAMACGYYFSPLSPGRKPCVILIHGWGDRSAFPLLKLAGDLAAQDISAVFLFTPFHTRRAPRYIREKGTRLSPDEWYTGYQMMVTDIKHLIDWLTTRNEIDNTRIGILGLSLGGFIGSIALGIDDRLKTGVFIVSGGNAGKITQLSRFRNFRKEYTLPTDIYELNQRDYYEFLHDVETKGWQHAEPRQNNYMTDALTYAHLIRNKPILMMNALWDEFVPREATLEFWQETGRQELIWFPTTHATIWAFYPRIFRITHRFLATNLVGDNLHNIISPGK